MVKNLQKVPLPKILLQQDVPEEPDVSIGFKREIKLLKSLRKNVPSAAIAAILARVQTTITTG